jgi:hypothetical protein
MPSPFISAALAIIVEGKPEILVRGLVGGRSTRSTGLRNKNTFDLPSV